MNSENKISYFLIALSAISIAVAGTALYFSNIMPAQIKFYPPGAIDIAPSYFNGNGIEYVIPLTLVNESEGTGVIYRAAIVIEDPKDADRLFYSEWDSYYKTNDNNRSSIDSNAHPLSLNGKSSVTKDTRFLFKTENRDEFPLIKEGSYNIYFLFWLTQQEKPSITKKYSFRINEKANKEIQKDIRNEDQYKTEIELNRTLGKSKEISRNEFKRLM